MKLKDVATIKVGLKNADFYVVRRGSLEKVGEPVRTFNPEHFGVKVNRIDIIVPDYLYYVFKYYHSQGVFKTLANGSLKLVNIKKADIENIRLVVRE